MAGKRERLEQRDREEALDRAEVAAPVLAVAEGETMAAGARRAPAEWTPVAQAPADPRAAVVGARMDQQEETERPGPLWMPEEPTYPTHACPMRRRPVMAAFLTLGTPST